LNLTTRPYVVAQGYICLAAPREDEHDRPIRTAEHSLERGFINTARLGRISRVSVDPDTTELLRPAAFVDLSIEVIGYGLVVELDMSPGAGLANQLNLFNEQEVVSG
jgi:hypothetical protein